jgi:hypothetical protein
LQLKMERIKERIIISFFIFILLVVCASGSDLMITQ